MQRRGKLQTQTRARLCINIVNSKAQTKHNAGVLNPLAYLHVLRRHCSCTSIAEAESGRAAALISYYFELQCS